MALFILRRIAIMLFTSLCLTFVVFFLTNLYPNLEKMAKTQGNFRMNDDAVLSFLENRGYLLPRPIKYGEWLGCHMIGSNVTEMIAEVVAARKLETTAHEIIKSVHPHPTMSEAIMEATAAAYNEVIHL